MTNLVEYRERLLPGFPKGGEVPISRIDTLLDVDPDLFKDRVGFLAEEMDRLDSSILFDDSPCFSSHVTSALEAPFVRRLDREGEYRFARRYALVKKRFQSFLRRVGLIPDWEDVDLSYFTCQQVPKEVREGHSTCFRLEGGEDPRLGQRLRARCRDYNKVRNSFIEGCLYIVSHSLSDFSVSGLSKEDLFQEGSASLFRAVDRYDWRKGVRFRTYAEYWILQSFREALYNQSRTVRIPAWIQKAFRKIRKAGGDMISSAVDLANSTGFDPGKIDEILRDNRKTVSLDQDSFDEDGSQMLSEKIESGEGAFFEVEQKELSYLLPRRIKEILGTLPSRERMVLESRFGLDGKDVLTLTEVGKMLGISAERVRQIQSNALRRLQEPVRRRKLADFN